MIIDFVQNESIKLTNKKHDILPFEAGGEVELERYSDKCDASLFLIGSHSKKRPNNVVMGRTYDNKLYDMIEFGVLDFKPLRDYAASSIPQLGNKVRDLLIFSKHVMGLWCCLLCLI